MYSDYVSTRNQAWLCSSILAPFVDTYIHYLVSLGYSEQSIHTYTHAVAHFAHWLDNGNRQLQVINEVTIKKFIFDHLPVCECAQQCRRSMFNVRAALKHLLKVLRAEGVIPGHAPRPRYPRIEELVRYETYLDEVRGLAPATRTRMVRYVDQFLAHKFGKRAIDIKFLTVRDLHGFVARFGKNLKPSSIQNLTAALRSYLRYRGLLGDHTEPLIASVPAIAQWRLANLPKALPSSEVDHLLNSFDRTTAIGRRDYAIIRCLVDLGLRAGEVAQIQIDDINWREGTLAIKSTKAHRVQLLPLPERTGEAIVDYLWNGRPSAPCRALFVRHRGPVNSAMSSGVVCSRVRQASSRCHMAPSIGAHICRHTAACQMLKAGASIKAIADILRHRRIDTTMIYAKIDIDRLKLVVAPWPGQ